MQSILEQLFERQPTDKNKYSDELQKIACNKALLKKNFNKWQKKRLLQIEDNLGLIADGQAFENFSEGVRVGVNFMIEIFDKKED